MYPRIICLFIGYCFGLIQTAFIYGKLHGIDIREHGSGNAGTTNTLRVLGTKAGLIVFLGDMLKSIVAILLVRLLIVPDYPEVESLLVVYTGAGCVLGHNFPFYMNFKGGKGIATTGGLIISTDWRYIPVGLVMFFGNFFATHYVSLGSLALYTGYLIQTVIMGELGVFKMDRANLIEMYVVVFLLTVLAFYMHRGNISRLIHHKERKTYLFKRSKMVAETNANALRNTDGKNIKVGVIGAGSWGTALSVLLSKNGHQVTVWSISKEEVEMLDREREHKSKLPGVKIPESIVFTSDIESTVKENDMLVVAVPSPYVRSTARSMAPFVKNGQVIVSVAKGIEEESLMTMSQIIEAEIPNCKVSVLCGPTHAEEVGIGLPTTIVAGAHERAVAEFVQNVFMNDVFRVYTSPDMLGMEIGAALKNVVALAAGIADGLGYGDNTKAALITRGIAEISRLGIKMGGKAETFSGLTGIGDLIVTCSSMHSRNRRAGILIGQGKTMQEAMDEVKMVVEGVYSAKAAMALAKKYKVELPIIEQVNKVLFENKNAGEAVKELMLRDKKNEIGEAFGK